MTDLRPGQKVRLTVVLNGEVNGWPSGKLTICDEDDRQWELDAGTVEVLPDPTCSARLFVADRWYFCDFPQGPHGGAQHRNVEIGAVWEGPTDHTVTQPAPIPEPQGLGSVIEAGTNYSSSTDKRQKFVLTEAGWVDDYGNDHEWERFVDPVLLHEGMSNG